MASYAHFLAAYEDLAPLEKDLWGLLFCDDWHRLVALGLFGLE